MDFKVLHLYNQQMEFSQLQLSVKPCTFDHKGIHSPVDFGFSQGASEHIIHNLQISLFLCGQQAGVFKH